MTITFDQLIALTTPSECRECNLSHAPVRSCEEARQWAQHIESVEAAS
jgi:hypothetical protein